MEDFKKERNRTRAQRVIKGLQSRNIEGFFVETREEACQKALDLMPAGSSIGWGGSVTLGQIGLLEAVKKGDYSVLDRDAAKTPEEKGEILREIFSCDYFLTGCNAISEDGVLVNIDGNGNRVAAIVFGPAHVLMVVGMNKIEPTVQDALTRVRNEAAPVNARRVGVQTPCVKTGCCEDCKSPDTICCQMLTTRYSAHPGRIQIILVNEDLGF